ncbi:MAG: hypothetical protein NXI17_08540 [Alphaproteobacteria bacterium]|nr:hypothetical protein [Alphaproteobacteria bacterium]
MAHIFKYIAVSAALFWPVALISPVAAAAQSLTCPDVASVFARDNATSSPQSINDLSELVGKAEMDGTSLRSVATKLRADFPKASDAEIADIMITVYCNYLRNDAPASHRTEANMTAFEKQAYDATFGEAPPKERKRGWLFE